MTAALLACDWGTTNLRAWVLDGDGVVIEGRDFDLGVSRLRPGEAAERFRDQVRPGLRAEGLPAVLCGMIGSNLGWLTAGYLPCPAKIEDLAKGLVQADGAAWIVPGLRAEGMAGHADVMRGEETQLFGWLLADPARLRGRRIVCHPGTHAKWVVIEDGRIVAFTTFMTGELFAVLRQHSVLKTTAPADDESAFDAGLEAAGDGAFAARLFTARTRLVAGDADPASAAGYLSGLLIGGEVAAAPERAGWIAGEPVALVGDARLCRWYARALAARGVASDIHDGEQAAMAGLASIARQRGLL
jgi:2-dehydro-3-deoxygalactonokinase